MRSKQIAIAVTFMVALFAVTLCGACFAAKLPSNPIPELKMISIPAGSFLMGNSGVGNDATMAGDLEDSNEMPQRSVTLRAYSIGKYEVTRGQFRKFMKAGGYLKKAYWSTAGWKWKISKKRSTPAYWAAKQTWINGKSFTQTDNHPVVGVTYYEAEAFCNWAGGHLPTEAQWERAARWTGTHANIYPWGDEWASGNCNSLCDNNSAGGGKNGYQTASVGSFPSGKSPSGCQDMAGNVWEWCKDWHNSTYYANSPKNDPQGPASGGYRVLRGGSWGDAESSCRCACRGFGSKPSESDVISGFRLAR
ncbi:MAG: formylglycine-generating enzyme family protein [Armatimonadetes bacterium]|nr:formylglycine-generating enzyme family protein [Armatimonadota bacterium]